MKFLKLLLDFYINASIHVAFSVYALIRITEIYFNLPYNEPLNYFVFFGTITGYNFIKYSGIARFYHRKLKSGLKVVQIFSFICFIAMCYYATKLSLQTHLLFLPFELLTLFYAVPVFKGFKKNLRSINYLKILIVSLVWAGFTVLVPVLDVHKNISVNLLLVFLQRFIIVLVLILPFDIRDLKKDAVFLHTLPQKIGVSKTKKAGFVLLLFTLILEFLITDILDLKNAFIFFFLLLLFFLMRAKMKQSKYYSSFWVECLPVLWWMFLLGIRKF